MSYHDLHVYNSTMTSKIPDLILQNSNTWTHFQNVWDLSSLYILIVLNILISFCWNYRELASWEGWISITKLFLSQSIYIVHKIKPLLLFQSYSGTLFGCPLLTWRDNTSTWTTPKPRVISLCWVSTRFPAIQLCSIPLLDGFQEFHIKNRGKDRA